MNKILTTEQAIEVSSTLQKQHKTIVLAGGCFDILHVGHIRFLNEAKTHGDMLFVMLENDSVIKKMKGSHRPLNKQTDRAELLANLTSVDYVIELPDEIGNTFYDDLISQLKPAIIATTAGDPNRSHKERQAKVVGAKVVDVIGQIENRSTTKILDILQEL